MLNLDEEIKLQGPPSNGSAGELEEKADETQVLSGTSSLFTKMPPDPSWRGRKRGRKDRRIRECVKTIKQMLICNKKAIIGVVISHLIFGIFLFFLGTLVPLNCQKDAIKDPSVTCPFDWIGHQGHCYNLSSDQKNWNESQKFCMSYNASLAKITKEEMDFVTNLTRNHVFWIGLKRESGQPWKWLDGENATLNVRGDGGDCAYLNDDATASSGRCTTEHRYICKKK